MVSSQSSIWLGMRWNAAADAFAVAGACSTHSNDGERRLVRTRIRIGLCAQGAAYRLSTESQTAGDEDSDEEHCDDACASSAPGGADWSDSDCE